MTVNGRTSGTIYATTSQRRLGGRRDRGRSADASQAVSYALTLRFDVASGRIAPSIPTVERSALVAHAAPPVKADLFTRDPASRAGLGKLIESRPNRSPERLNAFKDNAVRLAGIGLDSLGDCILADDLDLVNVRQSILVKDDANEGASQEVCPASRAATEQRLRCLGGYERTRASFNQHHLRPLFSTIAYGLSLPYALRFSPSTRCRSAIGRRLHPTGKRRQKR